MDKVKLFFSFLLALVLGSCANDNARLDDNKIDATEGTTLFYSEGIPQTRTSAKYVGDGLDFYWTRNDKIWVRDDNGILRQDNSNNIQKQIDDSGQDFVKKASFIVSGPFTGATHKVRYTGSANDENKVTIKSNQIQMLPNKADHIADDGDCGVATATKVGNKYNFTLEHKAAYITFIPFTTQSILSSIKLQSIRVFTGDSYDELAGIFSLDDGGNLSLASYGSKTNSITLAVGNFSIPSSPDYTVNGATMVVNPGTYNNVSIEYTVHDTKTGEYGTITKTYPSITFVAGKNKRVETDLQVTDYPADRFYMWDAQQNYWAGHEWNSADPWQPTDGNTTNENYPKSNTDNRWYREYPTLPAPPANHSATNNPNINELLWYSLEGDPHGDGYRLWATMGQLHRGGVWFKKKENIYGFNSSNYQGVDYRTTVPPAYTKSFANKKPDNLNDYFFLPAIGYYLGGAYVGTGNGYYWSSTPLLGISGGAYSIDFGATFLRIITTSGGFYGMYQWKWE